MICHHCTTRRLLHKKANLTTDEHGSGKAKTFATRRNGGSGEKEHLPRICADERRSEAELKLQFLVFRINRSTDLHQRYQW